MDELAILGANGQVGSEVSLILNNHSNFKLVPICRNRLGSAFLRSSGIPCRHGKITEPSDAKRLISNASVVANFALGSGTLSSSKKANTKIIEHCFKFSPSDAKIIHFSTVAVYGKPYPQTIFRWKSSYAREKIRCEKVAQKFAKKYKKQLFILRLGQVCGHYQGITQIISKDIIEGSVYIPQPEQASNTTHTATIANTILKISEGDFDGPGTFDLLNSPQWSWRKVYEHKAKELNKTLNLVKTRNTNEISKGSLVQHFVQTTRNIILSNETLKEFLMKIISHLSEKTNKNIQSRLYKSRANHEISELKLHEISTDALNWREVGTKHPKSIDKTEELLQKQSYQPKKKKASIWPDDI